MKSTIDTHLSYKAIGKGRGRGLKSLTSKGKVSTKSSLFESSDLVKKYIEVETMLLRRDDNNNLPTSQCLLVMKESNK
ncbi:hypothetical protein H5410_038616 [Solanum commersonii]|uniref:Uncharacterized protein n=1 Tax=Solanum commersonii TaxID=4109 RepID=A0A9J5YCU0_SOLCO|nr:hypothetical protein H5410_038616 [Solanum commersonii]